MPEIATAPPPAAPPASIQPNPPGPNLTEAFAGFDALVAPPAPDTPPPDKTTEPPPEGRDGSPSRPAGTPPPDKSDDKTPPPKPGETKPAETVPPKEKAATLRELLDRTRHEAADWKSKYDALVAESQKPKDDPEKAQLLKDREAWNKTRTELENELKFASYERSAEYKEKYQQPFLDTYAQGGKLIAALNFKEPDTVDPADGTVIEPGKTRKATEADWDQLMGLSDEDAANRFIAEHFGHNAARITVMRDKVLDLHGRMRAVVEDYRKQGTERETRLQETVANQRKEISTRWHAANQHAAGKYPAIFAPDPADPKGNTLLEAGYRLADLAFGVLDPADLPKLPPAIQSKFVNGQLPPAELVNLHSAIRNRAAVFDRNQFRLTQKDARIKELEDKLKGYEASEPQRGQARKVEAGGKPGVPSTLADVDSAFDRIAAGNG
jgi:hypothetical protein